MRFRLAMIIVLCLSACAQPRNDGLSRLLDEYFEDYLRENPEQATSLGRTDHDTRWRDWSGSALQAWESRLRSYQERLEEFDVADLDLQDRISLRLMSHQLEEELEGLPYAARLIRLNQLFGLHTSVLLTMREMPAQTETDYENMLARLVAVPTYVDQNIETLRAAIEDGVVQPRLIVEIVVGQLEAQMAPGSDESPLLAPFRNMPAAIPEVQRQELASRAARAYQEAFRPAWAKLASFLKDEYAPNARPMLAVSGLPGGAAIYEFFIRFHTTLDLSAREIHEIGLREADRIDSEMEAIARAAGFQAGSRDYERHLLTDPRFLFTSKEQMLAYHRDVAMRVAPGLSRLFRNLPRHRVGIRAIPPDREAASASNYNAPAADGSRPGWFNLKAYRAEKQSRFDKPALVLHETNPGHHLQIALQLEMEGLPEFRKIFHTTSYVEGWALYAETLGEELGVYDDPPSRFGALESERFRARRLVVDTGLHAMGWTREQAIEYLGDESEVDRYIAWPGQALAYKMGQLKILDLKAAAQDAYGPSFDIRDFHDAVLRNGPLPLHMLEERVRAYIDRAGFRDDSEEAGARAARSE
ncbi:MAG: DUF885 domain-containing protein [Bryobacterales bacterium]|nr:DUF885 domain-containing protein [Bryobacterales bacterium]